nr:unnamed protein product [Callosobruchus analis]
MNFSLKSSGLISKIAGQKWFLNHKPAQLVDHMRRKSSFRSTHLVTRFEDVDIIDDFNSTFGNFGGNTESLEERSFLRTQSSVLSRNDNRQRGNGTSMSRCTNFVLQEFVSDFHKTITNKYDYYKKGQRAKSHGFITFLTDCLKHDIGMPRNF